MSEDVVQIVDGSETYFERLTLAGAKFLADECSVAIFAVIKIARDKFELRKIRVGTTREDVGQLLKDGCVVYASPPIVGVPDTV